MFEGRIGAGVAKPNIETSVVSGECAASGYPIGHPAQGRIQNTVHEENGILRIWTEVGMSHQETYANIYT